MGSAGTTDYEPEPSADSLSREGKVVLIIFNLK